MKLGIQGIAGSYSEMTARDYIERTRTETHTKSNTKTNTVTDQYEIFMYSNFHDTIEALLNEEVDLIVVPVENSTTGAIAKLLDQLRYKPVISIAEAYQPVSHNLWAIEGTSIDQLTTVFSHPEALSQCTSFFEHHPQIEAKAHDDTAKASRYVKELKRPDIAAISSARAGELYGLVPLLEDFQDEPSNMTRFYVMEKKQSAKEYSGTNLSFYIETRHEAGALLKVLQVFDIFNGNLLTLTARPIENRPFTYGFFLEVSVEKMTSSVAILEQTLEQVAEHVQLIGQFNPVPRPAERN